ncbi:ribosomal maturation YjgA family protein [Sphingomonas sp. GB1N7]|uniref:ribosomal maturation YjgA family protein n=1 Tax=Parasphingomonas caseinilytica TaxID=3096158 RepID=UPI002FCB157A
MVKRRIFYAVATIVLFAIEVLIALYVHDRLIRPYVGDSIVVILLYTALRAMTPLDVSMAAAAAFAFACAVEVGQYFNLVDLLGLGHSALARTLLGTNFELRDFIAYAVGTVIVLAAEWAFSTRKPTFRSP